MYLHSSSVSFFLVQDDEDHSEDEEDVDMEEGAGVSSRKKGARGQRAPSAAGRGKEVEDKKNRQKKAEDEEGFASEVRALCEEGLREPHHLHHKILEMKSFRLACNRTDVDVMKVVLPLFLESLCLSQPAEERETSLKKKEVSDGRAWKGISPRLFKILRFSTRA